jgi:hypothetical protein
MYLSFSNPITSAFGFPIVQSNHSAAHEAIIFPSYICAFEVLVNTTICVSDSVAFAFAFAFAFAIAFAASISSSFGFAIA